MVISSSCDIVFSMHKFGLYNLNIQLNNYTSEAFNEIIRNILVHRVTSKFAYLNCAKYINGDFNRTNSAIPSLYVLSGEYGLREKTHKKII